MRRVVLPLVLLPACFSEPAHPFGVQDAGMDEEGSGSDGEASGDEGWGSEAAGSEATGEPLAGPYEPCSEDADCECPADTCDAWSGSYCVAGTCTPWVYADPDMMRAWEDDGVSPCPGDESPILSDTIISCGLTAEIVDDLAVCPEGMTAAVWLQHPETQRPYYGDTIACWWADDLVSGTRCLDDNSGTAQPGVNGDMLPHVCG